MVGWNHGTILYSLAFAVGALLVSGLVVLGRRWRLTRRRILWEDALKQICSAEHEGRPVTPLEIAGRLGLSPSAALRLVRGLESAGLVRSQAGVLKLTKTGERLGLHVLRGHRLWESYLAADGQIALDRVHDAAERAEHRLTPDELEALADHLGHPRTDPHGDVIPTAAGELGKRFRLQDDFPDLGEAMKQTEIKPGFFDDRAGKRFAIALAPVQLAGGPRVTVVQAVPYSEVAVVRALAAVRNSTLIAGLVALLGATALAAAFARSLTGPLVQMTKAPEGFARGERIKAPVGAGGEIGVLARAFASMTAQVEDKTTALRESEARQRATVDTAVDAIVVIDEFGTIQSANPAIRTTFGFAGTRKGGAGLLSWPAIPDFNRGQLEQFEAVGMVPRDRAGTGGVTAFEQVERLAVVR
jgi:Mn-dependent DtxR family transcriptional regulator